MAIGSANKAARVDQLRTYARCLVWSGYRSEDEVVAEVYEAALDEERDAGRAASLTTTLVAGAQAELARASAEWPQQTTYDRLRDAIEELTAYDIVVLEAVDDHWTAAATLERLAGEGRRPTGVAYFTLPDVWHAVEHGMLEINLWHGSSANAAAGDALLDLVLATLAAHGIDAVFDEGRIEATLPWQRR